MPRNNDYSIFLYINMEINHASAGVVYSFGYYPCFYDLEESE